MNSTRHHLAEVIGARSLQVRNFKTLSKELAAYLLDSGLSAEQESLMRDIVAYRAEHGVVEVTSVSAHTLSQQDIDDIKKMIKAEYPSAHSLLVDQSEDSDVIGGVTLNLPGEQLDLSVRAKVNTFKRLMTDGKDA